MLNSIKKTWNGISVESKTVRTFGFILSVFFLLFPLLVHGVGLMLARKPIHYWFGWPVLAAVMLVVNLFLPLLMKMIYRVAMFVAHGISWVVMHFVLGILFYLVMSPMSLTMRFMGKDLLDQTIDRSAKTYWKRRAPKPHRSQYERLF